MSSLFGGVNLLSWEFTQEPHSTYEKMRQEKVVGKHVVKTLGAELHAWVITGYEEARVLLADPRLSKDARCLPSVVNAHAVVAEGSALQAPRNMLFSDPPDHTRLRRLLGKAFTMRRVEKMRPWVERTTDGLLDSISPGEKFDFVNKVASALPIFVIGQLLGIAEDRFNDFREWSRALASVDTSAKEKQEVLRLAFSYLHELIEQKRAHPTEDLISALIHAQDGEVHHEDSELMSTIFLVMNAGYETTANMISSGVLALVVNPEQHDLLRADFSLLPGAVEEFLRYESPLNMSTIRFTTSPVEVGGVTIPENEIVFIALLSANRDPGKFSESSRLDIRRAGNAHLSFGHGIHHCLGAPLARMEGQIMFRKLLERFSRWELAVPVDQLRWRYTAQFRGLEQLPVRMS